MKTNPLSVHASPALNRSAAWRLRCARGAVTVSASKAIVRSLASVFGLPSTGSQPSWPTPSAAGGLHRWRTEGEAGLYDRPSRPHTTPHRTAPDLEAQVCRLRTRRKPGLARIGPILGLPASTVHRVLTRHGLHRLAWLDRPTGRPIRRYERDRPGEVVHVDVKKLGRIPDEKAATCAAFLRRAAAHFAGLGITRI